MITNFENPNPSMQTGLHVLGELYTKEEAALIDMLSVKKKIVSLVSRVGFNQVGFAEHSFEGMGYTLVVLLAESHISVHTWPEYGYVTLDVFVCNVTKDNSRGANSLFNAILGIFNPTKSTIHKIIR